MEESHKKLYDIKCIILDFKLYRVVYKGLLCIEAGRVPHTDYVDFEAISKSNYVDEVCSKLKESEGVV